MTEKPSPIEKLRQEFMARFGVPQDRIELVRLDLDILNRMGTFVRIHAGGLTMFETRATWAELGIPEGTARSLRYRRPPRSLIRREFIAWFRNTAQAARDDLDAVSVRVDFMSPFRWISDRDWAEWLERFTRRQDEWLDYRRENLLDQYNTRLQELVDDFSRSAHEAYDALRAAGEKDLPPRGDFVDAVVTSAVARMPSPQDIEQRLVLDYYVPVVLRPTTLEEEMIHREQLRLQWEREQQQARLEMEAEAEARRAEMERQRLARQAEMEQQRLEHLRRQAETLSLPLEQVLEQLREEVNRMATEVLDIIQKHGGLRGRAGERVRNLAQSVRGLETLGDTQLMELVSRAADLTRGAEEETKAQADARTAALEAVLHQIRDLVAAGQQARETMALVAREAPRFSWRSICLDCRYVWSSTGSLEPAFCPKCRGVRVVSRKEEN